MSRKLSPSDYEKRFREYGKDVFFEILTPYAKATEPMTFRHKSCGTVFKTKPWTLLKSPGDTGCNVCGIAKKNKSKEKGLDYFLSHIPSHYLEEYEFSGYTRVSSPVTATCKKCGRSVLYSSAKVFMQGNAGCKTCALRKPDSELVEVCDDYGFEYLSSKGTQRIVVKCNSCGRVSTRTISNIYKGAKCKYCSAHDSHGEEEVADYISSIYRGEIVRRTRGVLPSSKELDIYIPEYKVAVEFNGSYWHSAAKKVLREKGEDGRSLPDKRYHLDKVLECEENDIRLIQVWEHEWADERQQLVLKNIIASALHCIDSGKRLFARDLALEIIPSGSPRWGEATEFFALNNIQGNRGGSVVYALCSEQNGEILMAYKFGAPAGGRAKRRYQWEMVRGATKLGYQVIGGATRLWSHFIRDNDPDSVVYYIDLNYFNGKSPRAIGMEYCGSQYGVKNYFQSTKQVKNRDPRHHKEVMQLIEAGKVIPIYTAGTATYVYRKPH